MYSPAEQELHNSTKLLWSFTYIKQTVHAFEVLGIYHSSLAQLDLSIFLSLLLLWNAYWCLLSPVSKWSMIHVLALLNAWDVIRLKQKWVCMRILAVASYLKHQHLEKLRRQTNVISKYLIPFLTAPSAHR